MTENSLRFPSGKSVRRYKQEAKAAKQSSLYPTHLAALNAFAQQEMGLNWDLAVSILQEQQSDPSNRTERFEMDVLAFAAAVLRNPIVFQDRLTYRQREELKWAAWRARSDEDEYSNALGYGAIALAHYSRSAEGSENQENPHPTFSRYMQHWIYASTELLAESEEAKALLMCRYQRPETLMIEPGKSYWMAPVINYPQMTRDDIQAVMDAHPLLTHSGLGLRRDPRLSLEEREAHFREARSSLLNAVDECNRACRFLRHVTPRKTVDRRRTSYGLKHQAEHYNRAVNGKSDPYIKNGAFICAALHLGFLMEPVDYASPNAFFNISRRSPVFEWRKLDDGIGMSTEAGKDRYNRLCRQLGAPLQE